MSAIADLIRWIITYAVTGGFWHFVAVYLIVLAVARVTTLVKVDGSKTTVEKKSGDDR